MHAAERDDEFRFAKKEEEERKEGEREEGGGGDASLLDVERFSLLAGMGFSDGV